MDINITLLGQMITFAVFVWFTMKFVWPPITKAMDERQKRIADGLTAAEKSRHDLEVTQHKIVEMTREAKLECSRIIEQSNHRAGQILEEAKEKARQESQRILENAQEEINREINHAKAELKQQVASLAITGAEKIITLNMSEEAHQQMLNQLETEITS